MSKRKEIVEMNKMNGKKDNLEDSRLAWREDDQESITNSSKGCCGSSSCCCGDCCSIFYKYVLGRTLKLGLYMLDLATDISVAVVDYENGDTVFSAITIALVFLPGFLFALYAFIQVLYNTTGLLTWIKAPFWILVFPVLPLWPVIRDIRQIYHGVMALSSRNREHHMEQLNRPSRAYLVKFLEAFTEAAPQILLRLYKITIRRMDMPFYDVEAVEYVQVSFSFVTLSTNLMSTYQKTISTANIINGEMDQHERFKLPCQTQIFVFLWWVPFLMARFQSMALFAGALSWWIFVVIGVHILLVFLFQTVAAGKDRIKRIFIYLFSGFVFIFAYLHFNMKSRIKVSAWFPYAIFTILVFIENSVLLVAWFFHQLNSVSEIITPEELEAQKMYRIYLIFFHYGAFTLSIVMMILTFCCTPKTSKGTEEEVKRNVIKPQRRDSQSGDRELPEVFRRLSKGVVEGGL